MAILGCIILAPLTEINTFVPIATKENHTSEEAVVVQHGAVANPLAVEPVLVYCVADEQKFVTFDNTKAWLQSSPWEYTPEEKNNSKTKRPRERKSKWVFLREISFDKNGGVFFIDISNNSEDTKSSELLT